MVYSEEANEEIEMLTSIYSEDDTIFMDLENNSYEITCNTIWDSHIVKLCFYIPPNYPSEECLNVELHAEPPVRGISNIIQNQVNDIWKENDHSCVIYELISWLQEQQIAEAEKEMAYSEAENDNQEREIAEVEKEIVDLNVTSPTSTSILSLRNEDIKKLCKALIIADFQCYGTCYVHAQKNITIDFINGKGISVLVDGLDPSDVTAFCAFELPLCVAKDNDGVESFVPSLMKWSNAQKCEIAPGFSLSDGGDEESDTLELQYLPTPEELGATKDRMIRILSWGRKLCSWQSVQSRGAQRNFNAGVLNGRGGVNLRKMNGLSEAIQRNMIACVRFPEWLQFTIGVIEKDNLSCISINCTKGRHRSVAAAEILRRVYYPNAIIEHLTIR